MPPHSHKEHEAAYQSLRDAVWLTQLSRVQAVTVWPSGSKPPSNHTESYPDPPMGSSRDTSLIGRNSSALFFQGPALFAATLQPHGARACRVDARSPSLLAGDDGIKSYKGRSRTHGVEVLIISNITPRSPVRLFSAPQ